MDPRELSVDAGPISLGSWHEYITNASKPRGAGLQTQDVLVCILESACLQTLSLGSVARRAGMALAPRVRQPKRQVSTTWSTTQPLAAFGTLCGRAWQPQHQVSVAPPCPTKICTDCFLPNHLLNAKCILIKKTTHPPLTIFATFYCKVNFIITLF
jgi:hypothetical protein